MKSTTKNLLSLCIVCIFIILAVASSSIKHTTFTESGGQIPPEFKKFKDTLLVIGHPDDWSYNRYLRKNFSGNYSKPYKIIRYKELENYPVDPYRYVFDHNLNYSTITSVSSTSINTSTHASSDNFSVMDRTLNKAYTTRSASQYSKLMRAYIKALDKE